jgi:hypothetical protein
MRGRARHASRIHDRQVEVLTSVYRHLWEAHAYLQLMSASFRLAGEDSASYPAKFAESVVKARDEFFASRLLLPSDLAAQCDAFFRRLFEGQMQLGFAQNLALTDGTQRAEFWDRARKIAYEDVPKLLESIEAGARNVIHGSGR